MFIRRCVELLLLISASGCVAFQDCEYRMAQKCRAHRAWWCGCDQPCSCNPYSHYSFGWRRGYTDVLMGGDGECPPVPPQCYWSHKYQSENGEIAIENWYQGYSHGASAALASCGDRYHPVPISDSYRQCNPDCLSGDHAPYDFGKTILGLRRWPHEPVDEASHSKPAASPSPPASKDSYDGDDEDSPAPAEATPSSELTIPPEPLTESPAKQTSRSPGKWVRPASLTKSFSNSFFQKMNPQSDDY